MYVNATPSQRVHVALQRINNFDCGPNKLIVKVSVVESLARSALFNIYIHQEKKKSKLRVYEEIKHDNGPTLLEKFCKEYKSEPWKMFGKDNWLKFIWATKYRDLLIHESTFLREGISSPLIQSTDNVLDKLQKVLKL